jgi:hypothetical protein
MKIQPITTEEVSAAWSEAHDKLERIIDFEGDADGARREDWYFIEILREVILMKRQAADIIKKGIKPLPDALTPLHMRESNECN